MHDRDPLLQLKKGLTTLIVLSALEKGEQYGYELRRRSVQRTRGTFGHSEGALYPLLQRLHKRKLVTARLVEVAGRERRYYALTAAGHRALDQWRRDWKHLQTSLEKILR